MPNEQIVNNNGIKIACETFGVKGNTPMLLIMGGGSQAIMWPDEFCQRLANQDFYIIRYDQRDMGHSIKVKFWQNPYDLLDLTKDALAVLNFYEVPKAHIIGASMGGLVAQLVAAFQTERVESLILFGTSPDFSAIIDIYDGKIPDYRSLSKPTDDFSLWLKSITEMPEVTIEKKIEQFMHGMKIQNGSRTPFDEAMYRDIITRSFERNSNHEEGICNHIASIKLSIVQHRQALSLIDIPTLIIHGTEDPMFPIDHGKALAKAIKGSILFEINGLGHNLNTHFYDIILDKIIDFCRVAQKSRG